MKKILAFILCIIMFSFSAFAQYTVEDAYSEFKEKHSDFVTSITELGAGEELLISFLYDIYDYIIEMSETTALTEANFEDQALIAISRVSSREKYYPIQDALLILYPDSIKLALNQGKISSDLQPMVDTVKNIIFKNGLFEFSDVPFETPASKFTFSDLTQSHWAYDAINALSENFILNGYLDGTFRPDANITRGEFAKIIVSATDSLDAEATSSFIDVTEDKWYYHYVSSAFKNGYIKGYPDGTFRPEENITRADICTIVSRCLGLGNTVSGTQFNDDILIPSYAKLPVYSLVKKGIVNGMGDNTFSPMAYATRAQTAKIIYTAFFVKE